MSNVKPFVLSLVRRFSRPGAMLLIGLVSLYGGTCACIRVTRSGDRAMRPSVIASSAPTPSITATPWRSARPSRFAAAPSGPGAFDGHVDRQRVVRFDTIGLSIPFAACAKSNAVSYWERRISQVWAVMLQDDGRLAASSEERDAVWSVACGIAEQGPMTRRVIAIADPTKTWSRIYSFSPVAVAGDRRPRVLVAFVDEMDSATTVKLPPRILAYLGPQRIEIASPPPGYTNRDAIDMELESPVKTASSQPDSCDDGMVPVTDVRIGPIDGLAGLDRTTIRMIKQHILARARLLRTSAQTCCAIETGARRRQLFSLRFQRDGEVWNVIVEGPFESPLICDPSAPLDELARYFIDRMPADPVSLRDFWNTRHPTKPLPAGAPDLPAMRAAITKLLSRDLTSSWFEDNYGLLASPPNRGYARLMEQQLDPMEFPGLHDWEPRDLLMLELSLERIPAPLLPILHGTFVLRRSDPPAHSAAQQAIHTAGKTYSYGDLHTVIIHDYAYAQTDELFEGNSAVAYPHAMHTYLHEFGHIIGSAGNGRVQKRFNDAFLSTDARDVSWYARSMPESELFPEALAIYFLNGAWLAENHPKLNRWLSDFCSTGNAP